MKIRNEFTCPVELTHDMIRGKWKPIILWLLRKKPASLAELEKTIEGISQKMLLEQLRELIDYGFVDKRTFEGYPLKVEYFLKEPLGNRVIEALDIMQKIGIDYMVSNGKKDILEQKKII